MEFEWDESKSNRCLQDRGFDFAFAARAFFDPNRQVAEDDRYAYGEPRYRLTGAIEGRLFVVAYTLRGEVVRIISARKANQREITAHENRQASH